MDEVFEVFACLTLEGLAVIPPERINQWINYLHGYTIP
jgi:hypothetical protein